MSINTKNIGRPHTRKRLRVWYLRVVIGLIILGLVIPVLGDWLSIGFAEEASGQKAKSFQLVILPIPVLLTIPAIITSTDSMGTQLLKVVGNVFGAFFIMLVLSFHDWDVCRWVNARTLYQSKKNSGAWIMSREYGCGAVDAEAPRSACFLVKTVFPGLIRAVEVDTTTLDQREWVRIPGN